MLDKYSCFTSFTAKDLDTIKDFYENKLGLKAVMDERPSMLMFEAKGSRFMIYAKPTHIPAEFTVLNFAVDDLEKTVEELNQKGIEFQQYPEMKTNAKGIAMRGPLKVAWFKDPGDNIVGLSEGL